MIWANPWAWIGLAAVAVPIAVHLLARHTATAIPFQTLRFLRAAAIVDVRRRRLSDLLLLAVRVLIVALAAAALAQPFRRAAPSSHLNRIAIVDTSASVSIDDARAAAAAEAEGAGTFLAIERRQLRGAIAEAASWLAERDGAGAMTIVSDFQRGALDAADLSAVPAGIGVRVRRVPMRQTAGVTLGGVSAWSIDGARTTAAWGLTDAPPAALSIDGLDARTAAAVIGAGSATADASAKPSRAVTFVMPGSPDRAALAAASAPANEPWMLDMFVAAGPAVETVRVAGDRVLVFLAARDLADVADAVRRALPHLSNDAAVEELEPVTLTDDELRALEREPAPAVPLARPTEWAGRWFWIGVLALLALEALIRRRRAGAETEALANAA